MKETAFQDLIPDNRCFGCGPDNPKGLRIKSYWKGDAAVCRYEPREHQSAGPPQFLNGGIIATLIDCHSVCTAIADAYRLEGRQIGSNPPIWCVTANLTVTYIKPTSIDRPVDLIARILDRDGRKTRVSCEMMSDGSPCAKADVLAVRVPAEWKHGR
ncbi:MAG: PaaI family thioesterase [Desulfobacterales bacterium]